MVGAAWGQSPSDLVGTWSSIVSEEGMMVIAVLTMGEDFTYKMEIKISGVLLPMEQGTYELSGHTLFITPVTSQDPERIGQKEEITILSFSEDQLVLSMEDEVATFVRGIIEETQLGEGSISGTIIYSGSMEESEDILVMAVPSEGGDLEDFENIEDLSSLFMTSLPTVGPYTISGLPDGTYYVVAFMMNIEMIGTEEDWEPTVVGVYGTLLTPKPVEIVDGATITGIDLELMDLSDWISSAVAPRSWAQVKVAFQ